MNRIMKRLKSKFQIKSCVSAESSQRSASHDKTPPTLDAKDEIEFIRSNAVDLSPNTLYSIRDQMAISLRRMKDLEEQVKLIPVLKKQLSTLKEEKRQLQIQLRKDEATSPSAASSSQKMIQVISFTPQRISPVALESLGSRIRSHSQSELTTKKTLKRDVGIMCTQHTKDVGTLVSPTMVRSIGVNPTMTDSIHDDIFTRSQLDDILKKSIVEYEVRKRKEKHRNLVSIGTQMVPKAQPEKKTCSTQATVEKPPTKEQASMITPMRKDAYALHKPETRTVGSSEHKTTDILCERCGVPRRTVACGPDSEESKQYLSLKQMDMPPRSLSFHLGETEKLNIKRKTIGTQYQISTKHAAVQSSVATDSVGVQNVPTYATKSCQHFADSAQKTTDTLGLIQLVDHFTNTDKIIPEKVITYNQASNTDQIRTKDYGTNTLPPARLQHMSSNTDKVSHKDVGCGDVIKPHISIACADNYCDSCKDAIKNLAKEFSKVLGSPTLGSSVEHSRIPRPTTLTSPRPVRKKFMRQNTYTVQQSPSPSPVGERRSASVTPPSRSLSSSLDSISALRGPTGISSKQNTERNSRTGGIGDESLGSGTSVGAGQKELPPPPGEVTVSLSSPTTSWKQDTADPKPNLNGGESVEEDDVKEDTQPTISCAVAASSSHNNMLLTQIATSTSAPRNKVTPSKEMRAAMKVINDSLQKSSTKQSNLKNANGIVQREWFQISSTDSANPLDVEDYLDCFEEFSNGLLKYIVNLKDGNGNTAMHYAVSHGNFDVVSILLDSKVCDVNQMNNAGYTSVMLVSLAKLKNSAHRTVVQRLFQMADVNIRAKKHCQTALMLAVSHGNLDMVEMLLAAGADINIQDEDGSTALMCAAEHGRIDIVKHLLSQPDCDSLIQDVDGSTAFKIAWQAQHRDIGLLLYVHEQMLRSKMPSRAEPPRSPAAIPRTPKQQSQQQQSPPNQQK
ncbi:KN motif and ankyrin repeat domain-containing protein 2 isoform X3 [Hermetia illucens]|uniref:KN motif and ankyrin repeat domain-containing protein 2 isoform X3 n=1 Tax=Hermetia illucens TaxID=343691 RepID=UPI0018CC79C0|nr:KN motif and ankyrin repeat domain-containing protein 2 isoform X3 [Hermetia illucens]